MAHCKSVFPAYTEFSSHPLACRPCSLLATCSHTQFGLTFGSVHTKDNQNKYMSNTNHAPLPTAQMATCHAGVTGGTWPIVDGNDNTSPAPSHATCTAPCCLPPALSCAATATPTCHCCRRHPPASPHNTHPHPLTHLNHPRPSHTPNHPPAHPLHSLTC